MGKFYRTAQICAVLAGACTLVAQPAPQQPAPQQTALAKTINTYCAGCHNGQLKSPSNALLEKFDTSQIAQHPEVWAPVYRQMQAGAMPPMGAPRPDSATYAASLKAIEQAMASKPAAGASSQQIAARLAKVLWNSDPDEALLKDAKENRLKDASAIETQVRRMLADDRAQAFVEGFFAPWLQLNNLAKANPDPKYFPDYDPSLRDALTQETEQFLLSQLREDHDPLDLWTANYTYLNAQLAKHYGVANVEGPQFRRVNFSTPERAGLLGQGSILMLTSPLSAGAPGYTSPAARAIWIRRHYFGAPNPNPAPNAKPVSKEFPITPQTRLLPKDPCVTCHQNFFPLGYALEHFDALGRIRANDQMGPVDASGNFVDGTPFDGIVELRAIMLRYPDAFRTTITEKLAGYSSTGTVNAATSKPEDLIEARRTLTGMAKPRWSAIIATVVRDTAQ